jgi:hypothetical protein
VPELLGGRVHDQVLVLALDAAVPALEQVLHRDGQLAARTADQFLELVGEDGVGLVGLGFELQERRVTEHW